MQATLITPGHTLGGQYAVGRLLHRGVCGDWYEGTAVDSSREVALPTEFTSPNGRSTQRLTLVVRQPFRNERVRADAVGVLHRHLVDVSKAQMMIGDDGLPMLVQVAASDLRVAASSLPLLVAEQWRQLVAAVASALAHLHALEISHGAVQLDNVFRSGSTWRLGPTRCSTEPQSKCDMRALEELIRVELKPFVMDESQHTLLESLADSCLAKGVEAAHIAVGCRHGQIDSNRKRTAPTTPETLRVDRTPSSILVSFASAGNAAFVSSPPTRLPKEGSLVVEGDLDQFGTILPRSGANQVELTSPFSTVCVISAVVTDGIATIGRHVLIHPHTGWGHLRAMIHPQGLSLQWFWPKEVTCRAMRVQIRPDRYPQAQEDADAMELTCHRTAYDTRGQCIVPVPTRWDRVFVRVSRMDQPHTNDSGAIYGNAQSTPSAPRIRTTSGRILRIVLFAILGVIVVSMLTLGFTKSPVGELHTLLPQTDVLSQVRTQVSAEQAMHAKAVEAQDVLDHGDDSLAHLDQRVQEWKERRTIQGMPMPPADGAIARGNPQLQDNEPQGNLATVLEQARAEAVTRHIGREGEMTLEADAIAQVQRVEQEQERQQAPERVDASDAGVLHATKLASQLRMESQQASDDAQSANKERARTEAEMHAQAQADATNIEQTDTDLVKARQDALEQTQPSSVPAPTDVLSRNDRVMTTNQSPDARSSGPTTIPSSGRPTSRHTFQSGMIIAPSIGALGPSITPLKSPNPAPYKSLDAPMFPASTDSHVRFYLKAQIDAMYQKSIDEDNARLRRQAENDERIKRSER